MLSLDDFIDILIEICKDNKIQVTLKSTARGAAVVGAFSGLFGLMLGPVGLAVGGILGGVVAGSTSPKFNSVPEILINMSEKQKQQLCDKVVYAFRDFGLSDIAAIAAVISSQNSMKMIAAKEVANYLSKEMGLQVYR